MYIYMVLYIYIYIYTYIQLYIYMHILLHLCIEIRLFFCGELWNPRSFFCSARAQEGSDCHVDGGQQRLAGRGQDSDHGQCRCESGETCHPSQMEKWWVKKSSIIWCPPRRGRLATNQINISEDHSEMFMNIYKVVPPKRYKLVYKPHWQ